MESSGFRLYKVTTRVEFDAAMDCLWASSTGDALWEAWSTVDHVPETLRAVAVAACRDKMWAASINDAHGMRLFVTYDGHDRHGNLPDAAAAEEEATRFDAPYVLGTCFWTLYDDPAGAYPNGIPETVSSWPVGSEGSNLVADWSRRIATPRATWMALPHIGLYSMAVRPEWRRRGVGSMLLEWGKAQSAQLGLEIFIESTEAGRPFYGAHGFTELQQVTLWMRDAKGSAERTALVQRFLPHGAYRFHAMWMPAGGDGAPVADGLWEARRARDHHGVPRGILSSHDLC